MYLAWLASLRHARQLRLHPSGEIDTLKRKRPSASTALTSRRLALGQVEGAGALVPRPPLDLGGLRHQQSHALGRALLLRQLHERIEVGAGVRGSDTLGPR